MFYKLQKSRDEKRRENLMPSLENHAIIKIDILSQRRRREDEQEFCLMESNPLSYYAYHTQYWSRRGSYRTCWIGYLMESCRKEI